MFRHAQSSRTVLQGFCPLSDRHTHTVHDGAYPRQCQVRLQPAGHATVMPPRTEEGHCRIGYLRVGVNGLKASCQSPNACHVGVQYSGPRASRVTDSAYSSLVCPVLNIASSSTDAPPSLPSNQFRRLCSIKSPTRSKIYSTSVTPTLLWTPAHCTGYTPTPSSCRPLVESSFMRDLLSKNGGCACIFWIGSPDVGSLGLPRGPSTISTYNPRIPTFSYTHPYPLSPGFTHEFEFESVTFCQRH